MWYSTLCYSRGQPGFPWLRHWPTHYAICTTRTSSMAQVYSSQMNISDERLGHSHHGNSYSSLLYCRIIENICIISHLLANALVISLFFLIQTHCNKKSHRKPLWLQIIQQKTLSETKIHKHKDNFSQKLQEEIKQCKYSLIDVHDSQALSAKLTKLGTNCCNLIKITPWKTVIYKIIPV